MNGRRAGKSALSRCRGFVSAVPLVSAVPFALGLGLQSFAQAPEEVVRWSASLEGPGSIKPGRGATIELAAEILEGWHVYALVEPPGGPTPLKVSLADNSLARLSASPSGSEPEEKHDPSFDLDTRFYEHTLALSVPITVKRHSAPGARLIPVEVRFQSCSDRVCLPPKTVRLSVPVTVLPDT